jgi:hypothetical protein
MSEKLAYRTSPLDGERFRSLASRRANREPLEEPLLVFVREGLEVRDGSLQLFVGVVDNGCT